MTIINTQKFVCVRQVWCFVFLVVSIKFDVGNFLSAHIIAFFTAVRDVLSM